MQSRPFPSYGFSGLKPRLGAEKAICILKITYSLPLHVISSELEQPISKNCFFRSLPNSPPYPSANAQKKAFFVRVSSFISCKLFANNIIWWQKCSSWNKHFFPAPVAFPLITCPHWDGDLDFSFFGNSFNEKEEEKHIVQMLAVIILQMFIHSFFLDKWLSKFAKAFWRNRNTKRYFEIKSSKHFGKD